MTQPVYRELESPEVLPGGFCCRPGVVVVQLDEVQTVSKGGIYLPEESQEDLMADVGTVVAVGEEVQHRKWTNGDGSPFCHPMPALGSRVLVTPKHGKWVENFYRNGKKQPGFTRFYGFVGGVSPWTHRGDVGSAVESPWWLSVIMELETFQPTGDRHLVRHELREKTEGGIHLLQGLGTDPRKQVTARIVKSGPLCTDFGPGAELVYHEGASVPMPSLGEGMALVRESFVYGARV